MRNRTILGVMALATLVAVAACGDDADTTPATEPLVPPADSTLPPAGDGYEHPTGADDAVVRIGFDGGYTTPEIVFQSLPTVLVTGDGRVFQQGPVIAIYPGPLLPNVQVRSITEAGIQQLLAKADAAGLFEERTYAPNDLIADAPDTVVTITAGGRTVEHRAYALGLMGEEADEARRSLADFVTDVQALVTAPADDVLGPEATFEPDTFLVRALIVGDWSGDEGVEPSVVDWPAEAGVSLAGEPECLEVPASAVSELFEAANQLTWFAQDGVTYQLFVKPLLPGDGC